MSLFDLALLIVMAGYVFVGFKTGLIQSIGSIIGIFVAAWLAGMWYPGLANTLLPMVGQNENAANILAFIILFLIISKAIGLIFYVIDRAFRLVAIIPGMKLANRVGGAFFGLLEGALLVGVVMSFAEPFAQGTVFAQPLADSQFVGFLMGLAGWITPLLPDAIEQFQEVVPYAG